jgi:predicted RNA methylase
VGKHETGFARIERDFYPTPAWVIEALAEHIDLAGMRIWECACGDGRMVEALEATGASVYASDIEDRGCVGLDAVLDFVAAGMPKAEHFDGLVTNPPFGPRGKLAERFIKPACN